MLHFLQIKVEPYWNVKITATTVFGNGQVIKVEPYWNVKNYWDEQKGIGHQLK